VARCYYVQTPAFSFPLEPHYRLPYSRCSRSRRGSGCCSTSRWASSRWRRIRPVRFSDDARPLSRKQFAYLFPDAIIERERFLGLTKSLMAVRNYVSCSFIVSRLASPICRSSGYGLRRLQAR
jgi:hypothetical protein